MDTKDFFSEIIKSHENQNNDLKELLTVIPAEPVTVNVSNSNDCDFQPRNDKIKYNLPKKKSKIEIKTVRDIRTHFEKDILVDLPNNLEKQENILLRKIRDGSSTDSHTKTIAKNILQSGMPIKRPSWRVLMNMNLEGQEHPLQFVCWNGKLIRINGSRGGKTKFLKSFDLKLENPNGLKKDVCLKRNSLLQNPLSVNFKPGPLKRKKLLDDSYQKYNVGSIELVSLPKPVLEIQPAYDSALDSTISHLINDFRDVDGFLTEKWAEFAVSVLDSTSDLGLSNSNNSPLTFDMSYKCDQRRILMRRDQERKIEPSKTKNSDVLSISASDESDIIPEVQIIMNNMLNAVEISLLQGYMYSEDYDLGEETQEISISTSNLEDKNKKYCELDTLDVIRLSDDRPSSNLSGCRNSYCILGCICSSLQCALHLKDHCGRIECMFECKCDLSQYKVIDNFMLSVVVPKLNCENIEPWCMVHNLYRCFCKGKFVDAVATMKSLKNSEQCVIVLENETPDSEPLNKDSDSDKTAKNCVTRVSREKSSEKLSVSNENNMIDSENCVVSLDEGLPDSETSFDSRSDKLRRSCRTRLRRAVYTDTQTIPINVQINSPNDTENSSCARTKPYGGRKYSIGYYLNAGYKIINMESYDSNLRKRLRYLVSKSVSHDDISEKDELSTEKNIRIIQSSDDKHEKNVNHEPEKNVESLLKKKVNVDQTWTKVKPTNVIDNSSSSGSVSSSSNLKMIETSTDESILDNTKLVAWLESSYQQHKKQLDIGLLKTVLEPPEKGKVALHPWDFVLNRYSEQKNIFLISKYTPFRIFIAVDNIHPLFENCINIDDIKFADLDKYPITVTNLITNTSGLKDNFCILYGLSHCWELIGAVKMKINDSKDRVTDNDITDTVSEQSFYDTSSPMKLLNDAPSSSPIKQDNDPPSPEVQELENLANSTEVHTEALENSECSKWFVMTIENDFTEMQFYAKGFFVKYESIVKAINVARSSGKTVRLSSQNCADKVGNPQFGIYAIPNANEYCVFIGPYEIDDNLGIKTIKTVMRGVKPKQSRGVWITTNKVDNMKVINNPLSYMPSQNDVHNEMLLRENDSRDVSKDASPPPLPMPDEPEKKLILPEQHLKSAVDHILGTEGYAIAGTSSSQIEPVIVNTESMTVEEPLENLPVVFYVESQDPSLQVPLSKISLVDDSQSLIQPVISNVTSTFLQSSSNVNKQKTTKPVAEVAPQIKIASVYSEATENQTATKIPETSMLVLKPEEINKRLMENNIFPINDNSLVSFNLDTNDALDIEDFLDSSNICNDLEDKAHVFSDDEDESPIKNIWIGCSNVKQLGWIRGRINEEGEVSFTFPGFKDTKFYKEEIAMEKINEVLYRKVYVLKDLKLKWKITSPNEVDHFSVLKKGDLGPDICLTENGLLRKSSAKL